MKKQIIFTSFLIFLFSACNNAGNQPPVAQAGTDQVVFVGETVILDGSNSSDPDGDALAVDWAFGETPPNNQAVQSNPQLFRYSFVPDIPGVYEVQLSVNDGQTGTTDALLVSAVLPMPFSGISMDYDPEVRCSDNNWTTTTPVACSPQLSFTCPAPPPSTPFPNLSGCPDQCQACYDKDLTFLQSNLSINTITVYQPNYFILAAAKKLGIKVLVGLFNDEVLALATPDSGKTSCTFAGAPALCGISAINSLINGACGATTPWAPQTFCTGSSYIPALKPFFDDGTVQGVQLGNEILTSPVNAGGLVLTPAQVLAAAKTLRTGLNQNSYTKTPIVVSFVAGTEKQLCANGAPMANIDLIASHPYCNDVASVPPTWPFESGNSPAVAATDCANQVMTIYQQQAVAFCGASHSFIGETGYNTGCPSDPNESNHINVAENFISDIVTQSCQQSVPLFLFDYADACPAGGCLSGCPGGPAEGNGYFGIYYTQNYQTKGDLVLKLSSVPTLSCP